MGAGRVERGESKQNRMVGSVAGIAGGAEGIRSYLNRVGGTREKAGEQRRAGAI
jgi:hypothetical protein